MSSQQSQQSINFGSLHDSGSQMSNSAALSPFDGVGPQPVSMKAGWAKILACLESKLWVWVLRYAKLTEEQMVQVVTEAIAQDNIDSDSV